MLQPDSSRQIVQQRYRWLTLSVVVVFAVLTVRLWHLQIIHGSRYVRLADRNRVRTIPLIAPRGTITDRNNATLVENRPAFNVLLYRESMKDVEATSRFLVNRLGIRFDDLQNRLRRSRGTGLYRPVVVKEDVGIDDISVVETFKAQHPEVQLGPEPRRLYRYGRLASHVLGYVGEVSEDDLSREALPRSRTGDLVGKSGVERTYNQHLTGTDGKRQVLVDSVGREVGLLEEQDSVIGGDLRLTLDLDLQLAAERVLQGKVGAIVAMDPRDGGILAMASVPSFDPNSFSTRITEADWSRLVSDPNSPLQNRAVQNSYSPGSIFKLIMAVAGLEEGVIEADTRVYCSGATTLYNRAFHCHEKHGHGSLNLEAAIVKSCNIFFYDLGRRLGITRIAEHARELGLGERTGIDLPGERSGVMPSPEWKQQARGSKWYAGETISVSIGQGAVSVTPMQLLRAVAGIAAGGRLARPHVLFGAGPRVPDSGGGGAEPAAFALDPAVTQQLIRGMWGSVNAGTSRHAAVDGLDICGKTGTVQVIGNERKKELKGDLSQLEDHSWFVGFARRDDPEIAVVVFVEHGGRGGLAAAPLAREIFQAYYAKRRRGFPNDLVFERPDRAPGASPASTGSARTERTDSSSSSSSRDRMALAPGRR